MSFWSSQTILLKNPHRNDSSESSENLIQPFYESRVKESSYALSVGDEVFITSASDDKFDKVQKIKTEDNMCFIPPGQFAYIMTNETVNIPSNCLAFISMKFKIKADGLINVSGFHVDPGYKGKLIFTVYNAGVREISIRKGKQIFLIWFAELDHYDSRPRDRDGIYEIDSDIINNAKNADTLKNLSEKIKKLEQQADLTLVRFAFILALLVPLNVWLIKLVYDFLEKLNTPVLSIFIVVILAIGLVVLYFLKQFEFSIHLSKKKKSQI